MAPLHRVKYKAKYARQFYEDMIPLRSLPNIQTKSSSRSHLAILQRTKKATFVLSIESSESLFILYVCSSIKWIHLLHRVAIFSAPSTLPSPTCCLLLASSQTTSNRWESMEVRTVLCIQILSLLKCFLFCSIFSGCYFICSPVSLPASRLHGPAHVFQIC